MRSVGSDVWTWLRDERGGFAVVAALSFPLLVLAGTVTIDLTHLAADRSEIQNALDAAVLAAGDELRLALPDGARLATATVAFASGNWAGAAAARPRISTSVAGALVTATAKLQRGTDLLTLTATADVMQRRIDIGASLTTKTQSAHFFKSGIGTIDVRSGARTMGASPLCILALDPRDSQALTLTTGGTIDATACSSQTVAQTGGFWLDRASRIRAVRNCTNSTTTPNAQSIDPPLTLCPKAKDPLEARVAALPFVKAPVSGAGQCDQALYVWPKMPATPTIPPTLVVPTGISFGPDTVIDVVGTPANPYVLTVPAGQYKCFREITVNGGAKLVVEGGGTVGFNMPDNINYKKADGTLAPARRGLNVRGNANLETGAGGATFVFRGQSRFGFYDKGQVSLRAPTAGDNAGLLLVSTKDAWRSFSVQGQGTTNLLGTIYLPVGALWVSRPGDVWPDLKTSPDIEVAPQGAPSTVGAASAYTVLVVQRLMVTGGMKLVVNADYASTSVPVPVGLGLGGGMIGLSR